MQLFEIVLPVLDNSGADITPAHKAWLLEALAKAGGYTRLGEVSGVWRDPNAGIVYPDTSVIYRVACWERVWRDLVSAAFDLFPDQASIAWAEIGEMTVQLRDTWRQEAA